jgi:hypothetical protein
MRRSILALLLLALTAASVDVAAQRPPGVLANDNLAGGRILSFGPATGSEQSTVGATSTTSRGGTITLRADGSFSYGTPEPSDDGYGYTRSFTGLDSFRYVIQNASGTSSAAVNINVDLGSTGADFVVTTPGHYYAVSGLTGENRSSPSSAAGPTRSRSTPPHRTRSPSSMLRRRA